MVHHGVVLRCDYASLQEVVSVCRPSVRRLVQRYCRIINNGTMGDDEVVAPYVPPRYLFTAVLSQVSKFSSLFFASILSSISSSRFVLVGVKIGNDIHDLATTYGLYADQCTDERYAQVKRGNHKCAA